MTIHTLNLSAIPFSKIQNGTKIIESRLNDEKRQKINIGDELIFECTETIPTQTICTRVVDLHYYADFQTLMTQLPIAWFGHTTIEAAVTEVHQFYTKEQQEKHGVVGIKLQIIN